MRQSSMNKSGTCHVRHQVVFGVWRVDRIDALLCHAVWHSRITSLAIPLLVSVC